MPETTALWSRQRLNLFDSPVSQRLILMDALQQVVAAPVCSCVRGAVLALLTLSFAHARHLGPALLGVGVAQNHWSFEFEGEETRRNQPTHTSRPMPIATAITRHSKGLPFMMCLVRQSAIRLYGGVFDPNIP